MKKRSVKFILKKEKVIITEVGGKVLQVDIGGRVKVISRKDIDRYTKQARRVYPQVEDYNNFETAPYIQLRSDIVGIISEVMVVEDQHVKKDDCLLSISAMKVENEVAAPISGVVKSVSVKKGDSVKVSSKLVKIKNEKV